MSDGQCRGDDTTLVVGDRDLIIEDVSLERETNERESVQSALCEGARTYEGSFEVKFDDKFDALRFWSLFCGGAVSWK